jgi:hypothetical protein
VLIELTQHAMGTSWRIGVDPESPPAWSRQDRWTWSATPFSAMIVAAVGLTLLAANLLL